MFESEVSGLIVKLQAWHTGTGTLFVVEDALGCPSGALANFFYLNDLCLWNREPMAGVCFQHKVDSLLLWLALRRGVYRKLKTRPAYSPLKKDGIL